MDYEQKYKDALDAARHIYDAMKSGGNFGGMEDLEVIFPELCESEDERIICAIKEAVVDYWSDDTQAKNDILSWLEKQKEQNDDEGDFTIYHPQKNGDGKYKCIPFSFYGSLTSFSNDKDLMDFLNESFYDKEECERWCEVENKPELPECKHKIKKDSYIDYLCESSSEEKQKEQKPAEWSEEDDGHIDAICNALTDNISNIGFYTTEALCSWLKSLPHRFSLSSWGEEIRDGFFGKFNHNSWKPSEEQMEALKHYVDTTIDGEIDLLYNDLKKLM